MHGDIHARAHSPSVRRL